MRDLFWDALSALIVAGLCLTIFGGSCFRILGDFLMTLGDIVGPFTTGVFGLSGAEYRKATDVLSRTIFVNGESPSVKLFEAVLVGAVVLGALLNLLYIRVSRHAKI